MDDTVTEGRGEGRGLEALGMTREELLAMSGPGGPARRRDGRVCACGHPMTKHIEVDVYGDGRDVKKRCRPVRSDCECQDWKPVLEASDTRPFLRKTKGHAGQHALMTGIAGLVAKDRGFEWLDGWPRCELAGWPGVECDDGPRMPYSVNERGVARPEPAAMTLLACRAHGLELVEKGLPR